MTPSPSAALHLPMVFEAGWCAVLLGREADVAAVEAALAADPEVAQHTSTARVRVATFASPSLCRQRVPLCPLASHTLLGPLTPTTAPRRKGSR